MKTNMKVIKPKRGAVPTTRRFVIKETYAGKRKLPELLTDLLCDEYRRSEQKNIK